MASFDPRALELTVRAGEVLLQSGAEIFRVQETMLRIAAAYHVEPFHVYVISNGIFCCVDGEEGRRISEIRHTPLSPVHLGRVAAVNALSRGIVSGQCTLGHALQEVARIESMPFKPAWAQVVASGIGSAGFGYLFGANLCDAGVSFLAGALLQLFLFFFSRHKVSKILQNLLGSAAVTLVCILCCLLFPGLTLSSTIIGAILPLVPGVPLTTAVRDFFNADYLSGTIRLIDAVLVASCIALGVGFMLKLYSLFPGGLL